jgi:hypothetical protein
MIIGVSNYLFLSEILYFTACRRMFVQYSARFFLLLRDSTHALYCYCEIYFAARASFRLLRLMESFRSSLQATDNNILSLLIILLH